VGAKGENFAQTNRRYVSLLYFFNFALTIYCPKQRARKFITTLATSSSAMAERPRELGDFKGGGNFRLNFRLNGYVISAIYTLWTEKTPKCFIYSIQNVADCDKIWYILSWI